MIENEIVKTIVDFALITQVLMIVPCAWRAYRGPSIADRLLAIDLITTLLVSIIILLAVVTGESLLVDLGLALAALAFIATVGMARYISEGRVF